MRIEITLAKATPLPAGALEALTQEFTTRIDKQFDDPQVSCKKRGKAPMTGSIRNNPPCVVAPPGFCVPVFFNASPPIFYPQAVTSVLLI
jgi:hypothetical protein